MRNFSQKLIKYILLSIPIIIRKFSIWNTIMLDITNCCIIYFCKNKEKEVKRKKKSEKKKIMIVRISIMQKFN